MQQKNRSRQDARERNPSDPAARADGSQIGDVLCVVTAAVSGRPRLTLCLVILLAGAALALTGLFLGLRTNRADLIDPRADFHQRWMEYTENFGETSDMIVVVEAPQPVTTRKVLSELGSRLRRDDHLFENVLYKIPTGPMRRKALQFLSRPQLDRAISRLKRYQPILDGRWDLVSLDSLLPRLHYQLHARAKDRRRGMQPLLTHTHLLADSLHGSLVDGRFRSPWPSLLQEGSAPSPKPSSALTALAGLATIPDEPFGGVPASDSRDAYFLQDGIGFLKVRPVATGDSTAGTRAAIERLREHVAEVQRLNPGTKLGLTGIPVLEHDEMRRSRLDMLSASLISFAGVAILLIAGFRGVRHPLLCLVMLSIGTAWAFGYTTFAVGHLNILSISFAVILIGLGIDFGIHYLARYLELRHSGQSLNGALLQSSAGVGSGIVTAGVTTALAFFCATFTQFLGVAELGLIAGGGILLCCAATFLVLPPLLALSDRNRDVNGLPHPPEANAWRLITCRRPLLVTLLSLAVIAGVGFQMFRWDDGAVQSRLHYDYNLLNLQADGLESVDVQNHVFEQTHDSVLFAVALADSPEEARRLHGQFAKLPTVHHVEDLASHLPEPPDGRTAERFGVVRSLLSGLPDRPPEPHPMNPAEMGKALERMFVLLRDRSEPLARAAAGKIDGFLDAFEQRSLADQSKFVDIYQRQMTGSLLAQFQAMAQGLDAAPVRLDDLPPELTHRFVSGDGKWLLQIYPKEQIWDVEPLTRFVNDVRSVDPDVTGTPLQNFEASRQIMDSYQRAAVFAFAVICAVLLMDFLSPQYKLVAIVPPLVIVAFAAMSLSIRRIDFRPEMLALAYVVMVACLAVLLDFRNFRDAVLAMLPPLAGGLLMFGMLVLLRVNLNPANLIVLPLVLGIGVDDGVHVIHDFRLQTGRYRTSSSTINAIVLTSLTSMIGFGSMMVAAHKGLFSVGLVLVVGIASCLFVSLITLPAILTLVSRSGQAEVAGSIRDDDGRENRRAA